MTITLNHTIVPARDKEAAARLFAQIFGLAYKGVDEHFARPAPRTRWEDGIEIRIRDVERVVVTPEIGVVVVKVNDTLTFLFAHVWQCAVKPRRWEIQ